MRKVECTPGVESGREIGQARARRSLIVKTLGVPTTIGAILLGPNLANVSGESHRGQVREALAEVEAKKPASELEIAQSSAAQILFGYKGKAANLAPAKEAANRSGKWENLDFTDYLDSSRLDSDKYQISADGKTLTITSQDDGDSNYGAIRIIGEDGTYVAIGEEFRVEGEDSRRLGQMLLAGGALNGPQSDINKDGIVTQEELNFLADKSARENLQDAFKSPAVVASNKFEGLKFFDDEAVMLSQK